MAKHQKSVGRRTKSGRFAIGGAAFAKISAVEGISLTDAMKKRADDKRSKRLTAEEHRRAIIRSHRKD
jgi:hypothetical protein